MSAEQIGPIAAINRVVPLDTEIRTEIQRGLNTIVYSPYLHAMIDYAVEKVQEGVLDPQLTELALCDAAMLFRYSDESYSQREGSLKGDDLTKHQRNVLGGTIELVRLEAATSDEEAIRQVTTANDFLSGSPDVQATLATINYGAFFRPQTMASGTRTLDRSEIDDLLATLDTTQEAMPHLTVSNWAIGQTVAGVYRFASEQEMPPRVRVFDIGSGHGATIAAMTSSISKLEGVEKKPELAITALEATPEFYKELATFVENDEGIANLGLQGVSKATGDTTTVTGYGKITMIQGDAAKTLQNADLSSEVRDTDITVITGNYSWHRLGRGQKSELMKIFSKMPNVIFVIGDLAQNTSTINKRYFNLGVNGPLNAGNHYLREQFGNWGYFTVDTDKQRPSAIDPRIANRIAHDHEQGDGHLWIAYWGKEASESLDLMNVPQAAKAKHTHTG